MEGKQYRVVIAASGKQDVKAIKEYVLDNFKYRELAEKFIKKAMIQLDAFPSGYRSTGFAYRGYGVYIKPYQTYLLFHIVNEEQGIVTVLRVLQDGMNWEYVIRKWLKH